MTSTNTSLAELLKKFDFHLPESHIAHEPAEPRDTARMLVINRNLSQITHQRFYELPEIIEPNSVLVINDTKVYPARLQGKKTTGGKVELLIVKKLPHNQWEAMSFPGLATNTKVLFDGFVVNILEKNERVLTVTPSISESEFMQKLQELGHVPIPPYIKTKLSENVLKERYQTIYATETGSAAAPTAGLHFTQSVFDELRKKNIEVVTVTLHVGLGTFAPLTEEHLKKNKLHTEYLEITSKEAEKINQAKQQGRKIIAVGTTSARTLESAATDKGLVHAMTGETSLFIQPGYKFKIVDGLITNFHVPQSSLLMMITALCTYPNTATEFVDFKNSLMGRAYKEAIEKNYRFYSFGDACFIQ